MPRNPRDQLELRTIEVSTRAALRHARDARDRELVRNTATELLARLEQRVIRDGADADMLAEIERSRRRMWE